MEGTTSEALIEEQLAFYREGAGAFDRWLQIVLATPAAAGFRALTGRLVERGPFGDVLEIAAGTGRWTKVLLDCSKTVTALDASPESLAILDRDLGAIPGLRLEHADAFAWEPDRRYDTIFFGDWLAHVPDDRFETFWATVERALKPGGEVFFSDQLPREDGTSTAPEEIVRAVGPNVVAHSRFDATEQLSYRQFADGRTFRVIARYLAPDDLKTKLDALGWTVTVDTTDGTRDYLAAARRHDADREQSRIS
jgi:SAM-dependent methyltransferase